MSKFTKEMVNNYAGNLLITLTEEENELVLNEFDIIDKNCDIVNNIPGIEKVEPKTHALDDFVFSLREDIALESVPVEDLLSNCSSTNGSEIEIPKVVEKYEIHE